MSIKPALMCPAFRVLRPTWVPVELVDVLMRTWSPATASRGSHTRMVGVELVVMLS